MDRVGHADDRFWNAVLGGDDTQTISERCALAAQRDERWGCVACRLLAWMIEPNHCAKTLDPAAQEGTWVIVRVGVWFLLLTILAVLLPWFAWHEVVHLHHLLEAG